MRKIFAAFLLCVSAFFSCGFLSLDAIIDDSMKGYDIRTNPAVEDCVFGYRTGNIFVFYGKKGVLVAHPTNDFTDMAIRNLPPWTKVKLEGKILSADSDDFGTWIDMEVALINEYKEEKKNN